MQSKILYTAMFFREKESSSLIGKLSDTFFLVILIYGLEHVTPTLGEVSNSKKYLLNF